ncbi:MAG: hypothetical protein HN392_02595 [Anaerolineae bacterium]|nr:hypothetical protein [Anaerolineae bacterium]MBT7075175.1 hypothetical protein [Anaerolineae bacterium]MBT7782962.1 hypothetical protein [Anaerolineae bacterium]
MAYFNTVYTGNVDADRYERWSFYFSTEHTFTAIAIATSGDLVPLIRLLDLDGTEVISGEGSFTTTLPAGSFYFVQIEPLTGSGDYEMSLEKIIVEVPTVRTTADTTSLIEGESTTLNVTLDDIPETGYTSAEFTCTYPADLLSISNISATELFGANPVTALSGPENGSFIFAIAGSNGQKALISGLAFTFDVTALLVGNATVECTAKAPEDNVLQDLASGEAVVLEIVESIGTINGEAFANKSITITLSDSVGTVIATTTPDVNGIFSLTAPAGSYTLNAEASGHLIGENTAVVIVAGEITNMDAITLLAGDITGDAGNPDGIIDQLDAISIGMNYNSATPDIADLNADGIINVLDLEFIARNYGQTGPQSWIITP